MTVKHRPTIVNLAKLALALGLLGTFVESRIAAARPGPDLSCGGPQCSGGCSLAPYRAGRVHPDTYCCAVVGTHCMCVNVNSSCN